MKRTSAYLNLIRARAERNIAYVIAGANVDPLVNARMLPLRFQFEKISTVSQTTGAYDKRSTFRFHAQIEAGSNCLDPSPRNAAVQRRREGLENPKK